MGAVTLEHVAMEARPYPSHLLEGCETGLVLFAAAFLGHNDAIHFAEAGIETLCIDINRDRLREMSKLYPDSWSFLVGDAWEIARNAQKHGTTWDVVSCDTFTGEAERRSLASLPLWCSIARKLVTVTTTENSKYKVPGGWQHSRYERAHGVYWLVLERK